MEFIDDCAECSDESGSVLSEQEEEEITEDNHRFITSHNSITLYTNWDLLHSILPYQIHLGRLGQILQHPGKKGVLFGLGGTRR